LKINNLRQGITALFIVITVMVGIVGFLIHEGDVTETDGMDFLTFDGDISVTGDKEETSTQRTLPVHIVGAVANPGVYYLYEGSIVLDVLNMAGGPLENADTSVTNLAARISDGMKIVIYTREQVEEGDYISEETDRISVVNINYADKGMLMTLPGIGESRAEAIIAYREKNGRFNDISEIMNVSGIKEAAFEKIKEYITI